MLLELTRRRIVNAATEGDLQVDGTPFCFTLEDIVRADPNPETPANEAKVYGATAIPAGTYRVVMGWSPRFQKMMMRVEGVPGFSGILIHRGNSPEDTLGCILVGDEVKDGRIPGGKSTPAYDRLWNAVTLARARGQAVDLVITEAMEVP